MDETETVIDSDSVVAAYHRFRRADAACHQRVRSVTGMGDNELRVVQYVLLRPPRRPRGEADRDRPTPRNLVGLDHGAPRSPGARRLTGAPQPPDGSAQHPHRAHSARSRLGSPRPSKSTVAVSRACRLSCPTMSAPR